jgi:hypothetical protein
VVLEDPLGMILVLSQLKLSLLCSSHLWEDSRGQFVPQTLNQKDSFVLDIWESDHTLLQNVEGHKSSTMRVSQPARLRDLPETKSILLRLYYESQRAQLTAEPGMPLQEKEMIFVFFPQNVCSLWDQSLYGKAKNHPLLLVSYSQLPDNADVSTIKDIMSLVDMTIIWQYHHHESDDCFKMSQYQEVN